MIIFKPCAELGNLTHLITFSWQTVLSVLRHNNESCTPSKYKCKNNQCSVWDEGSTLSCSRQIFLFSPRDKIIKEALNKQCYSVSFVVWLKTGFRNAFSTVIPFPFVPLLSLLVHQPAVLRQAGGGAVVWVAVGGRGQGVRGGLGAQGVLRGTGMNVTTGFTSLMLRKLVYHTIQRCTYVYG